MFKQTIICIVSFLVMLLLNVPKVNAIKGAVEDGLVGYWSFNKETVNIQESAQDIFSGLIARVNGDPELASASDCKVGECILFDGNGDYFFVEDTLPAKIDRDWNEITLECWTYINALDDSWNRIISLDDQPTNSKVVSLYYDDDDNRHGLFVKVGGEATQAAEHTVLEDIPLQEWLHLVGTFDGTVANYYVNGKLAKTHNVPAGKIPKGGLQLSIGDRSDGCNCDAIQGYVDEFRIYDRALTAAEVQNNMDATGLDVAPTSNHLSVTWAHIKSSRR